MIGSRPTQVATLDDVRAMREGLDMRRRDHVRLGAILAALSSGLRRGEVCGLTVGDLAPIDGVPMLRVRTLKRRKEIMRHVPLLAGDAAIVAKYIGQEHGGKPDPTAPLFRAAGTRHPFAHGPITPKGIACALRVLVREVGQGRRLTPHSFRHGFATALVQTGADLRTVQELLGHANLGSTQRYLHTTTARCIEAVVRLSRSGIRVVPRPA